MLRVALVYDRSHSDRARLASQLSARIHGASLEVVAPDEAEESWLGKGSAFDAVVLHALPDRSATLIKRAAAAGKHVLAELPLGQTLSEAEEAIRACREAGVLLMPATARFVPGHAAVHEALAAGKLGVPGLLRIHRWEARAADGNDAAPREEKQSALVGRMAREIDLASWIFAALPMEVYAVARTGKPSPDGAPDYLQLHLGFPNGGMALIDFAWSLPAGDDYYSLSLIGGDGAAYADDHHNMQLRFHGGPPEALRTDQGERQYLAQIQEFVNAIREERRPSVTGDDAVNAMRVAQAAQESLERGEAVKIG